jgi:hypothetical protein
MALYVAYRYVEEGRYRSCHTYLQVVLQGRIHAGCHVHRWRGPTSAEWRRVQFYAVYSTAHDAHVGPYKTRTAHMGALTFIPLHC